MMLMRKIALASSVVGVWALREAEAVNGYDYIIVGGGTAGSAVATRLSQGLPGLSILLIEAGPAALDENKINVPGMRASTIGGPLDWNFTTVPQPGGNNRKYGATRGKVLGGSSAFNFMLWNRASTVEYDAWEELGSPGWHWESVLEGMMKSENFTGNSSASRGTTGPIHTVINRWQPEQQDLWFPAMHELGLSQNVDSLGGHPLGVMYQPNSINPTDWKRSYSANSYLPAAGPNLRVLTETRVAKVNLGKCHGKWAATGVTLQNGTVFQARKEVIVSAGTFQSPGILELSGIGQTSVLENIGIETLIDLPGVGENLQDHLSIRNVYQLKPEYTSLDKLRYNATYASEQLALWNNRALSHYDYGISGVSFMNWKTAIGDDAALLSLAQGAAGNSTNVVERKKLDLVLDDSVAKLEVLFGDGYTGNKGYPAAGTPLFGQGFFAIIGVLMHTLSRGSVHVGSANISAPPLIDPKYLSNDYDLQAAVEAAKYVRKVAQSQPLAEAWVSEYEPGLDVVETDAQWIEYVRNNTISIYHPAGTCAMLPREDGGVVDSRLRVWGTTNLRVVDASIIPVLIASHTQTAVYGIAEVAAQMIIQDCNRD
ncbi:GMC oxidoreductase [Thozetella sp. PMI_491]|nr:GMC oxidoreductase [Thozetella sp. PMI_491]